MRVPRQCTVGLGLSFWTEDLFCKSFFLINRNLLLVCLHLLVVDVDELRLPVASRVAGSHLAPLASAPQVEPAVRRPGSAAVLAQAQGLHLHIGLVEEGDQAKPAGA